MSAQSNPPTARAAVFHAPGQPLTLERFPLPELKGGEALARIRCATICGSDLHSFHGRRQAPTPSVLGHEMVGELAAIGPAGVRDFYGQPLSLGDRVTWSMVWSCGDCFYCRRGLRPKCERLRKFGHEAITPERALFGGLAEYCHLPEKTAIFRLPPELPDLVASPANCATATVAAVARQAGSLSERHVVIHGAGMLGLTACAMAAANGAASVLTLEPGKERREQALAFGATHVFDSALPPAELSAKVGELTGGRGADLALEFSGDPGAMEAGIALLRPGGRLVLAGATYPARPLALSGEEVVRRLLQIIGVYNYEPEDLGSALRFLAGLHQRRPFARLVGRTFSLQDVNAAFAYATKERPPRVALIP
jgi:alcohol dehydrogenase